MITVHHFTNINPYDSTLLGRCVRAQAYIARTCPSTTANYPQKSTNVSVSKHVDEPEPEAATLPVLFRSTSWLRSFRRMETPGFYLRQTTSANCCFSGSKIGKQHHHVALEFSHESEQIEWTRKCSLNR